MGVVRGSGRLLWRLPFWCVWGGVLIVGMGLRVSGSITIVGGLRATLIVACGFLGAYRGVDLKRKA